MNKSIKELKKEIENLKKKVRIIEYYLIAEKKNRKSKENITDSKDDLYTKAFKIAKISDHISSAMLQRILGIPYGKAARIIDDLEMNGIIGPAEGSKPRKVIKK